MHTHPHEEQYDCFNPVAPTTGHWKWDVQIRWERCRPNTFQGTITMQPFLRCSNSRWASDKDGGSAALAPATGSGAGWEMAAAVSHKDEE